MRKRNYKSSSVRSSLSMPEGKTNMIEEEVMERSIRNFSRPNQDDVTLTTDKVGIPVRVMKGGDKYLKNRN